MHPRECSASKPSRLGVLTDKYLSLCEAGRPLGQSGRLVLDMLIRELDEAAQSDRRLTEFELSKLAPHQLEPGRAASGKFTKQDVAS